MVEFGRFQILPKRSSSEATKRLDEKVGRHETIGPLMEAVEVSRTRTPSQSTQVEPSSNAEMDSGWHFLNRSSCQLWKEKNERFGIYHFFFFFFTWLSQREFRD